MKRYLLSAMFFLTACASGGAIATLDAFYEVPVGATQEEVVAQLGPPFNTYKCSDGVVEYEYIERIKAGSRNIAERKYYIQLKDGKVVSKGLKRTSPPAYRLNSYEMQTTKNDGELRTD